MFRTIWSPSRTAIVVFVVLLVIPLVYRDIYVMHVLLWLCLYTILASSLHLIMRAGQVSFAHVAFMAVGAYGSAVLSMQTGLSVWLSLLVASAGAAIFALPIGMLVSKLRGAYFFVVTFAVAEIVVIVFGGFWTSVFGGHSGIVGIRPPEPILGIIFDQARGMSYYYLVWVVAAVTFLVLWRLENCRFGRILSAMSEAQSLTESIGINVAHYALSAFVIGSFFAGIVGGLYAHFNMVVTPGDFTFVLSLIILSCVVVGGREHIAGPVLGATFLTLLSEFLKNFQYLEMMIYGLALVLVMLFMPRGILGLPVQISRIVNHAMRRGVNAHADVRRATDR